MATITLKPGTDLLLVKAELEKAGITVGQQLPDGRIVAFINSRKWLCMQYPALIPLFQEDRVFWKTVRKRSRNGEDVPKSEIEAHAKWFNEQFDKIINGNG